MALTLQADVKGASEFRRRGLQMAKRKAARAKAAKAAKAKRPARKIPDGVFNVVLPRPLNMAIKTVSTVGCFVGKCRRGGTADLAGVCTGLRILAINDRSTAGVSNEVAKNMVKQTQAPNVKLTLKQDKPGSVQLRGTCAHLFCGTGQREVLG